MPDLGNVSQQDNTTRRIPFLNIQSAVQLGAQAVLDHQRLHPECDGQPKLMAEAEECRGLAVSEVMQCKKCGFTTHRQKLYTEIPKKGPGRRTATPNMAFQVGLYNTGIATAGARRLLAALDTTVPSSSGLQKIADKCGGMEECLAYSAAVTTCGKPY